MRLRDSTPHDIGVAGFQHDRSDLLFEELGLLSPEEVDRVRERQHEADLPFTEAAKEMGLLDQTTIDQALATPSIQNESALSSGGLPSPDLGPPRIAHGYAQEMRKLLFNLAGGHAVQRTPQRMVITGVNTVSEASTVAVSMAMTCAASGFRVLLVDYNFLWEDVLVVLVF
jgi:Mrp family chromosome partitioning ATPase